MKNNLKKNKLFCLEAASPEETRETLRQHLGNKRARNRPGALSIHGPKVLVRQFSAPRLSSKQLEGNLRLESSEVFSMPPHELELDYQILDSSRNNLRGIFVAAPSKLLKEYYLSLTDSGIIPVKITASLLASIDSFLTRYRIGAGSLSLVDFFKNDTVNLAIFNNKKCVFLREILYENLDEALHGLMDSLKYACSKGGCRKLEEIYFSGNLSGKDEMIASLQKEFGVRTRCGSFTDIPSGVCSRRGFFRINLIKRKAVSWTTRKWMLLLNDLLIACCIFFCIFAVLKIKNNESAIQRLRSSFTAEDYEYARALAKALQERIGAK